MYISHCSLASCSDGARCYLLPKGVRSEKDHVIHDDAAPDVPDFLNLARPPLHLAVASCDSVVFSDTMLVKSFSHTNSTRYSSSGHPSATICPTSVA